MANRIETVSALFKVHLKIKNEEIFGGLIAELLWAFTETVGFIGLLDGAYYDKRFKTICKSLLKMLKILLIENDL